MIVPGTMHYGRHFKLQSMFSFEQSSFDCYRVLPSLNERSESVTDQVMQHAADSCHLLMSAVDTVLGRSECPPTSSKNLHSQTPNLKHDPINISNSVSIYLEQKPQASISTNELDPWLLFEAQLLIVRPHYSTFYQSHQTTTPYPNKTQWTCNSVTGRGPPSM